MLEGITFFAGISSMIQNYGLLFFLWLTVAVWLLIIEMGNPGLFLFVSFSFGAICAAIAALLACVFFVQCLFFLIGSACAFYILKRWIVGEQKHTHRSNIYALQGEKALVIQTINPPSLGEVKVSGQIWRAESLAKERISANEVVRIVGVRGTRLIVEKI